MAKFEVTDKLLNVYTNKNQRIFKKAAKIAYEFIPNGVYGFIYDDFNPNIELINKWKAEYKTIKVYNVSTRRKTIKMDSKVAFYDKMKLSYYTPESYYKVSEIPNNTSKDDIFFVKTDNGTGGNGVDVYRYEDIHNIRSDSEYIIQKSMSEPDLYNNRRYKIRQLVLIHNKHVYASNNSFFTVSDVDYLSEDSVSFKYKHVINQRPNIDFILSSKLKNFNSIFSNIKLALGDFSKYYCDEISSINDKEYVILGFDFVVDKYNNVQIIEINHRSNYGHPDNVSDICDVGFIKDTIILMITNSVNSTSLLKIV